MSAYKIIKGRIDLSYHFILFLSETNALRAFMDVQIWSHSMAGAVVIVEPKLPQRHASHWVKARAEGSLWNHKLIQRDMTLELRNQKNKEENKAEIPFKNK